MPSFNFSNSKSEVSGAKPMFSGFCIVSKLLEASKYCKFTPNSHMASKNFKFRIATGETGLNKILMNSNFLKKKK